MDDRRLRRGGKEVAVSLEGRRFLYDHHRTRLCRVACGFLFAAVGVSTAGCTQSGPAAEPGPVVVRVGVPEADITASDVGLNQVAELLTLEGLTTQNPDGRARPRLAERWTASDDGLTWRFILRNGINFHDGSSANASVIVDSLRATSVRARRGLRPGLADIISINALGPSEIEIRLRRPSTFLLDDLDLEITRVLPDKSVVGTGAFRKVSGDDSQMTFEAHETYYQGRPKLDRVVVRAYPTLRTAWASLMRQEIDVLWDLSRDAVEFAGSSDVALHSFLRHYVYVIAFNSVRPKFASTPVRRALNAAIDRDALIRDVLRGQGLPASGPVWPLHWAYDSALKGYAHDPSLAGTTLEVAGLKSTMGRDGRRSRLTFQCILPENWVVWERLALNVQKQLYDIGVDMQLQMLSAEEFNKRLRTGDFDAVMIELLSGPFLSRPYAFWRWGGEQTAYNVFGYRSAAADRWFDAIRSAPTDAEYRVAAGQLQRALLDDPPALFLAWSQRTRAVNRRFNVQVDTSHDPMPNILRWTVGNGSRAAH
jgi:peptide/nickel transport system substrate-binding protein